MGKFLKKFENKSNFQNFLNNHRLFVNNDNDNIISYIKNYENNNYKVKYADNSDLSHYIYSFSKNELNKCDGFCSKYYNLKVPSSINCYGLYSRESDPDKSNKYILTFLKQDYIKAGVPYVLEINEVNNDNEYILEKYDGEVDTSDLLINDEYFTSVYTTDKITIGQYYSFFNSALVISMGSDLTKLRNCYWSKNVFIDSNLSKTKFINEKPYVDLGLPSGLL